MNKLLKSTVGVAVVALGLAAGSAQAGFITGSLGLSDAGITLSNLPTSMVSQLTTVTLGASPISGCTVDVVPACPGTAPATVMTIPLTAPGAMSVTFSTGPFTWNFTQLFAITRNAPTNPTGLLPTDSLLLIGIGTVTGAGFDPTAALLAFSATGNCIGTGTSCNPGTATATWNATLSAVGASTVPEPGVLALMGLGLAALGFSRRSKA